MRKYYIIISLEKSAPLQIQHKLQYLRRTVPLFEIRLMRDLAAGQSLFE